MDKFLLEAYIKRKGFTIEDIAKEIGIDKVTFYRKMNGESDFYRREISIIVKKLNLTIEEMELIFFGLNVT